MSPKTLILDIQWYCRCGKNDDFDYRENLLPVYYASSIPDLLGRHSLLHFHKFELDLGKGFQAGLMFHCLLINTLTMAYEATDYACDRASSLWGCFQNESSKYACWRCMKSSNFLILQRSVLYTPREQAYLVHNEVRDKFHIYCRTWT